MMRSIAGFSALISPYEVAMILADLAVVLVTRISAAFAPAFASVSGSGGSTRSGGGGDGGT